MKIARIATVPFFLYNHLRGQIQALVDSGHDVTLISSDGPEVKLLQDISGVQFHCVRIPRKISPLSDLVALWQLFRLFRCERYDIVHSTTPKAGMLTAIAARLAHIPVRLHTFTGQVWIEKSGLIRYLAKMGDRMTAMLDTQCYADSQSQREFVVAEGVAVPEKVRVLGAGSLAGVDLLRFDPEVWKVHKEAIRAELNIAPDAMVIAFIGRLARDKGITELAKAFQILRSDGLKCVLLLVGPGDQEGGGMPAETADTINHTADVICVGYSAEPERYLAIADVLCLPSYREGFGNVVIEAAAMGVPTVGTDIAGLRDSIAAEETGILVRPKDCQSLALGLYTLLTDDMRRKTMGIKARERAVASFDARKVDAAVLQEYARLVPIAKPGGSAAGRIQ